MILAVAAGMQPNLTFNPLEPAATITAFIVQVALGDLPHGSIGYQTIFAAGLTLMLFTLLCNIAGHVLRKTLPRGLLSGEAARVRTIRGRSAAHKRWDAIFALCGVLALMIGVLTFVALFVDMAIDGVGRLSWDFFTNFPSRRPGQAGILSAWVGSTLVMLDTAFFAVPLGVAAGVYLEEYAPKNWITDVIEINITNLAGVPSIVYGLLALGLFVYQFGLGQSILTAGLTLALLILPVVIVATREAIRSIPQVIREGAVRARRHAVADRALPHPAVLDGRHPHRRDHRHGARDRRDRADHHHRRAHLHRLPAAGAGAGRAAVPLLRVADVALHRDADPDVQLDLAARGGVPRERRRRGLRAGADDARHERARDLAALPPAEEHQMVRAMSRHRKRT